jgi:hypothetical protein
LTVPTVLRAYGAYCDVDALVSGCTLPVFSVRRRGEPVISSSDRPLSGRYKWSEVYILVSAAGLGRFPSQVEEATEFLRAEVEQVRRLCTFPGVEGVALGFECERRDDALQIDRLPSDLVRLAGALGLEIELSHWRISHDEREA